jgi:hypothetical protein
VPNKKRIGVMSDNYVIEVSPQEHSSIRELIVSFLRAIDRFRAED